MVQKPSRNRRLSFEGLENRAMLAGNLSVSVVDSVLQITGDNLPNQCQIRQLPVSYSGEWPGASYEIRGTDAFNRAGTTINGQPLGQAIVVSGVKAGVTIGLKNGDNFLRVANVAGGSPEMIKRTSVLLPGAVVIGSGGGRDDIRLYMENNTRAGVYSGGGEDALLVSGSKLCKLTVNTDPLPSANGTEVGARDTLVIRAVTVNGPFSAWAGLGDDFFQIASTTLNGNVNIAMGLGGDILSMNNGTVTGYFSAELGEDDDYFSSRQMNFNSPLSVKFESGDDDAFFRDTFAEEIILDGGEGDDQLSRGPNNSFTSETIVGFERDRTI